MSLKADLSKIGLYPYSIYPDEDYTCNDLFHEPVRYVHRVAEVN
jgi:hypothetical protein